MVTVLMSTYNGEKYVREQIESILKQKNIEVNILVRDDGSTDSTIDILKEYQLKYSNFKWYKGPNLGCGRSFFQLILDAPISEYYAFADQDDVWDDNKLKIAVDILERNNTDKPSLYCSTARPVDEDLNYLPMKKTNNIKPTFGIALTQAISPGCSYVFNFSLLTEFKKIGIGNIDIHDWAIFRVATAIDSFLYFDIYPHFSYRQHGNNVIGYQKSIIKHWTGRFKRFLSKDYRKIRYSMAKVIKEVYYEEMSCENKELVDIFTNYNSSISNRMKLVKSKDIRMLKKLDNIVFKILVILNFV